jgi:hypothetical protein
LINVSSGSRTVLVVTSAERQLALRFRTKSLRRESRQFRARPGHTALVFGIAKTEWMVQTIDIASRSQLAMQEAYLLETKAAH